MIASRLAAVLVLASAAACAGDAARSAPTVAEANAEVSAAPPPSDDAAPAAATTLSAPPAAEAAPAAERTGSVVVHVVDRAGAVWAHPIQVSLFEEWSAGTLHPGWTVTTNGTAEFADVPAGRRLCAWAFPSVPPPPGATQDAQPSRLLTVRHAFDGPAAAGERADVTVVVGASRPAASGRLVGSDGRPAAGTRVGGQLFGAAPTSSSGPPECSLAAASDGTFRLEFDAEIPESGASLRLAVPADPRTGVNDVELRRVPWTREHAGVLDVGDVALPSASEFPVVAAGRVVVPEGFEMSWAQVEAVRRAEHWWAGIRGLSANATPDGRFEIRGPMPADESLWIVGRLPEGLIDAAVPFRPGATEVEVRVVRPGRLEGTVRLPRGTTGDTSLDVCIEGEASGGGTWGHGFGQREIAWTGPTKFVAEGLHPGSASVVIRAVRGGDPLARIDGVQVRPGATADDPRLASIDLRANAQVRSVCVVDESGRPLVNATVHVRPAASRDDSFAQWRQVSAADGGVARLAVFGGALDLVADAPGFAPADAHDVDRDSTITLHPARPSRVTVRLDPAFTTPEPPLTIAVQLVWAGTDERPLALNRWVPMDPRMRESMRTLPIRPGTPAVFEVGAPGRWKATIGVTRQGLGGGSGQILFPPRSTEVLVTDEPRELEIVVGADPDRYAEVCRDLAK
jgi:hypothetical protein